MTHSTHTYEPLEPVRPVIAHPYEPDYDALAFGTEADIQMERYADREME